jgi:predicted AAA+ superfamily ATPase
MAKENTTSTPHFERALVETLAKRMQEPRHFLQVVTGPRQTGKTTAIRQALDKVPLPYRVASADLLSAGTGEWLMSEWEHARLLVTDATPAAILVIDEVQNIEQWSSYVKALWDEDAWSGIDLRVVLSGSSPLLLKKGLAESLMGRFEVLRSSHWSFAETREAFNYDLDEFLMFGGYPASVLFKDDALRWEWYMNDAVIEATLSRDVLQMEEVRKPALLRKLFLLGCQYSAQELSYRKILGQLDDKGNTATIAHYLELLSHAGLLCALQKYDGRLLQTRKSSPRLMAYDTALMTATSLSKREAFLTEPDLRGRLIESAVGAYLLARAAADHFEVFWWRDGDAEVDFVLQKTNGLIALEVKSGRVKKTGGLQEFVARYPKTRLLIIGDRNHPVSDFLLGKIPLF